MLLQPRQRRTTGAGRFLLAQHQPRVRRHAPLHFIEHGLAPDGDVKVQRLQRSRLHGRFQREARVQRRWEELKALAVSMQQQEMQQAAAARQQQLKSR